MLALLVALAGGAIACGGGSGTSGSNGGSGGGPPNSGTTAGNYTVNITGASGSSTATGSVSLTVQ
jgi:hypothetical protein